MAIGSLPVLAQTTNTSLLTYDRGWLSNVDPNVVGNDSYLAGMLNGADYHDYFSFAIPTLSSPILSATLNLFSFGEDFSGAGTINLYAYTNSSDPFTDANGYNNLVAGDLIGTLSTTFSDTDAGSGVTYSINLNTQGLQDIDNASGEDFIVGGNFAGGTSSDGQAIIFAGTGHVDGEPNYTDGNTELVFTQSVPEPPASFLFLLGIALLGGISILRRQRTVLR